MRPTYGFNQRSTYALKNSGNVIERSEYAPYGELLNRPLTDGPGYTGHVQDAATGLTYMQQRYYDPQVGRFLSVDPVTASTANGSNFNRYKYASINPYLFVDPDGQADIVMFQRNEGLAVTGRRFDTPTGSLFWGTAEHLHMIHVYKVRDDSLSEKLFTGPRLGAEELTREIRTRGFYPGRERRFSRAVRRWRLRC
ncbi:MULTISPECIES: RHS repeat-associated core domain-containing protein [unclassified Pseudoxanthomonas]|uniref:RHS repeat-associated core domain-containing protein n=1 Tax=unclassified Pseudoxanthomonas TaxID=2645906 RepID=UPI003077ED3C